jgi:hypothetical protein
MTMNDERLEQLLHEAADAEPATPLPTDLADRVRRRLARRRRRQRLALGGGTVVLLLAATVAVWHLTVRTNQVAGVSGNNAGPPLRSGLGTPPPLEPRGVGAGEPRRVGTAHRDAESAEVLALRAQVKQLQEDLARLGARIEADDARRKLDKRLAALRRELAKPDPRDLAMAEIEKTAFLVVDWAETCEKRGRPDEARHEYQQVVSLFPDTSWAKLARERLNKNSQVRGENR